MGQAGGGKPGAGTLAVVMGFAVFLRMLAGDAGKNRARKALEAAGHG
jgi:hypothetical protein